MCSCNTGPFCHIYVYIYICIYVYVVRSPPRRSDPACAPVILGPFCHIYKYTHTCTCIHIIQGLLVIYVQIYIHVYMYTYEYICPHENAYRALLSSISGSVVEEVRLLGQVYRAV